MSERGEEFGSDFHRAGLISDVRIQIGASTKFWCSEGEYELSADLWRAISGASDPDFNVALCHGPDPLLIRRCLSAVTAFGAPSIIMLAGSALASAQVLSDAGWVCVGATPVMALSNVGSAGFSVDAHVRRAAPDDLVRVRRVVRETFGFDDSTSARAVPDSLFNEAGVSAWILEESDELRSCMIAVVTGETMVCWSMATLPSWQGRGYGRRLLSSVLAQSAHDGVLVSLLCSSPSGEPLYHALGYEVLEYWQMWSRPRWILGRN